MIYCPWESIANKWICTDVPSLCLAAQPHLHFADPAEPELPMLEHSPRGRVERNLEHEVESRQSLHNFKVLHSLFYFVVWDRGRSIFLLNWSILVLPIMISPIWNTSQKGQHAAEVDIPAYAGSGSRLNAGGGKFSKSWKF